MWQVDIIYAKKIDRYYTGITEDLEWRLQIHNEGWGKYTKCGIPWKLVYAEEYNSKSAALHRERTIKNLKSRKSES